ncbi:MAG: histidine kinase [Bacilli bacterium]|nr:histidine kinase [Bacilli bacterium]
MKGKKRISLALIVIAIEIMLIVFSAITSFVIVSNDTKRYRNENLDYISDTFKRNEDILNERGESLASFCYEIMASDSFQYLKGHYYDITGDLYSKSMAINGVRSLLNSLVAYNPETFSVSLFIEGDEYEDTYISTFEGNREDFDNIVNNYNINESYYTYNGSIYFLYGDEYKHSIIAIKLSDDYLIDFFSRIGTLYDNNLTNKVVDEEGNVFFITTNFENPHDELINKKDYFVKEGKIVGNEIYITHDYLDSFTLCAAISLSNNIDSILAPVLVMLTIVIIIELGAGTLLTYNVANKPMKRIINSMGEVENGNFDVRINARTISDFQEIYDGFNKMVSSLDSYINENYIQQLQIKESEFKFLQSQINPHFLYNCFANISSLCQIGDSEKAYKLTKHLSKYFYYITESSPLVPLNDEYSNMIHFLEIQKIRFGERVSYDIEEIKEDYKDIVVPKLILQPIVENSFKYVFSKIDKGGLLKIRYYKEVNYIKIIVEDNGKELSEEDIAKLNERIANASLVGQHGLTNIYRRIEYFSDGKSSLHLSKSDLGGIKVELKIYIGEKDEKNTGLLDR